MQELLDPEAGGKPVRVPTAADVAALSPKERAVLGWIYIGTDGGHHRRTLNSLLAKGWIVSYDGELPGKAGGSPIERLPLIVKRYTYPTIAHHMAWCAWCAEQPEDDAQEAGSAPERP